MTIHIHVDLAEEWPATARVREVLERAASAAAATAGDRFEGEIGVSFVSEAVITELNRRYLGRDESTDVIAFQRVLQGAGLPTTVRQRRGIDVDAGCGQLATGRA